MSSSKARTANFYSPIRVECDQKDIIISHLKDEVYHLQHHEQDFYRLQDQYRALDHKFRVLSDEKMLCDAEFKDRHDANFRTVAQLHAEIDALRAQLREKHMQIDDCESDEGVLIAQLDQRLVQLDKLKLELSSLLADQEELLIQRSRLEQAIGGVRKDNEGLGSNVAGLTGNNDSVRRKTDELDKYLSQLKNEEGLLKDKIRGYESENNGLDADINATSQDVTSLENSISEAQKDCSQLQSRTAEATALGDKYKSEAQHCQRALQAESLRSNDLAKMAGQAEQTLRLRRSQLEEGSQEVAGLVNSNTELSQLNGGLREDIEYCRKHLENLGMQNSDLVMHLQKYSEEDEIVRNLIDRKGRVGRARLRVEEASILLTRNPNIEASGRKTKILY